MEDISKKRVIMYLAIIILLGIAVTYLICSGTHGDYDHGGIQRAKSDSQEAGKQIESAGSAVRDAGHDIDRAIDGISESENRIDRVQKSINDSKERTIESQRLIREGQADNRRAEQILDAVRKRNGIADTSEESG